MKTNKTNASRLLDKSGISYELISCEADELNLSAIHVPEQLNERIEQVFKTHLLKGGKTGYFVTLFPERTKWI